MWIVQRSVELFASLYCTLGLSENAHTAKVQVKSILHFR